MVRVDSAVLDQLRALGGEALVQRLITLFLESSKGYVEQIEAGLDSGELGVVETASHTLKSGAGSLGAKAVHHFAEDLESAARAGELGATQEAAAKLKEVWLASCADLEKILEA